MCVPCFQRTIVSFHSSIVCFHLFDAKKNYCAFSLNPFKQLYATQTSTKKKRTYTLTTEHDRENTCDSVR